MLAATQQAHAAPPSRRRAPEHHAAGGVLQPQGIGAVVLLGCRQRAQLGFNAIQVGVGCERWGDGRRLAVVQPRQRQRLQLPYTTKAPPTCQRQSEPQPTVEPPTAPTHS